MGKLNALLLTANLVGGAVNISAAPGDERDGYHLTKEVDAVTANEIALCTSSADLWDKQASRQELVCTTFIHAADDEGEWVRDSNGNPTIIGATVQLHGEMDLSTSERAARRALGARVIYKSTVP